MRAKEKLPRGLQRRGNSIIACFTHPDTGWVERRSLGNISVAVAKEQRAIWRREIRERRYVKPVPRIERVKFAEIADLETADAKKREVRHLDTTIGRVGKLKEWWGERYADEISLEEIENKFREQEWAKATYRDYRQILHRIFELAIDAQKLTTNPLRKKAKMKKLRNERKRELSYEEEARVRAAIRELYPSKEAEFDLALHLGCRASNLYGISAKNRTPMEPLLWRDVSLAWKVVNFPRSKEGSPYSVPINTIALAAFKELRKRSDGSGPVIRKTSGLSVQSYKKWFGQVLAKANIEGLHWHDLRHTFATRLRAAGVPIEDIAALLDHEIPELRMTTRYARPDIARLRKAVSKLEKQPKTGTKTDTKTDTPALVAFPAAQAV